MKRRKFVIKAILGTPFLLGLPSCSSGRKPDGKPIRTDKKILIIGAGIAGLGAAKFFKDLNIDVTVIEAQGKVGGRLKTDRSLGFAFDEGASWIHGPSNGNPITALAKKAGAKTFRTDDSSVRVFDMDGSTYANDFLTSSEAKYERILEDIDGNKNESFQSAFFNEYPQYQHNRLWTYMLSAYLEFDTGGDISELSSLDFYDDEAFGGDDLIITNGYDKIAEYLAQGIEVKLNTKVLKIDYSKEKTLVTTNRENFEADFVLLTVPLGILKENIISFTPTLPRTTQAAIHNLKMGSVNKFLCLWDNAFWDTDLQYIGFTPETKGKFNYFLNVKKFANINALMTFAFGNFSKQTEDRSDAEIIAEIMKHLKVIYGNNIPEPTHMLRTKWVSNEYSFGSYSFVTNGSRSSDFEVFGIPIKNKLFFAGEHTSRAYRGTVHGAYLSGIRAAQNILDLL